MSRSLPLVYSSRYSTFSNVRPPSSERKMPRSGVGAVRMAEHRHEQPIRVGGIDHHVGDHLAVAQPEMRPRRAGVGGLVHAVAGGQVGADDAAAAPDIDDVRVGRRHGDRADRAGGLVVEDRHPVGAVVGGAPHAAVVEADVEHVGLAGHAVEGARAPGAGRTDRAPVHVAIEIRRLGRDEPGRERDQDEGQDSAGSCRAHGNRLLECPAATGKPSRGPIGTRHGPDGVDEGQCMTWRVEDVRARQASSRGVSSLRVRAFSA